MVVQAGIFYLAAVYGGIEETMNQNAADIFSERITNRKNELETQANNDWFDMNPSKEELDQLYAGYENQYGDYPLTDSKEIQTSFLKESSEVLIHMLRNNKVNGVFLILNDKKERTEFVSGNIEEKNGVCIRDLDQSSSYTGTEDLLLERAPSAMIDSLGCSLESWWEAKYTFTSQADGRYYYNPLNAAWDNSDADNNSLAYFDGAHHLSAADQEVVSFSVPLMDKYGYPYGVVGVELSTRYLQTLLPNEELGDKDKSCYVLALNDTKTDKYNVILGTGPLYNRCCGDEKVFSDLKNTYTGGFSLTGREGTRLYGDQAPISIYNNNNPFERHQLVLMGLVDHEHIFSVMTRIQETLATVSLFTLALGLLALVLVSRRFSSPITALSNRVKSMSPRDGFKLDRLGIEEIDQLVDSIEELNRNASRNTARTEFFSRMSHDMRTPMNAIISFSSEELLENADEKTVKEYLNKIHTSGEYLLGLINEVLDMTKIENNKIVLEHQPIQSTELWDATLSIIEELAQEKTIHFTKDIQVNEDNVVLADEQHLNQILINLLSNSVKFTRVGGYITLKVREIQSANDPNSLRYILVVSDNGIGMNKQFMRHMYDPFEQESEGKEGTGLGLSIAKNLVELMNGTISCESEKGKGTSFTIQIELKKYDGVDRIPAKSGQKDTSKTKSIQPDALKGKRVLVCEDHPLNLQIITTLLGKEEVIIEAAENGQIGLDMFRVSKVGYYDLIFMDIHMPVLDGLETTRRMRSLQRADAKTIPIIAMTANAFEQDVKQCMEAGMNEHLAKPVEPQKVFSVLREYLS